MTFKISSLTEYNLEYQKSLSNPNQFWQEKAEYFHWFKKFTKVNNSNYETA